MRSIAKERETKETTIQLFLNLDGGEVRIASGIGFLTTCSQRWLCTQAGAWC